jgi:peptidoglycan/LPS O-acetylase OafA/YrhL
VVTFHADGVILMPFRNRNGSWPFPPLSFIWGGHTGVTLFFVLSAFLLALPFLEEAYGGKPVSWRSFWERRALRILPLYWSAVLVGAVITANRPSELLRALPYLAFLNSDPPLATPIPPFSNVWWSLATEIQFYALLPFIALAFGRSMRTTVLLLVAATVLYTAFALGWALPTLSPLVRALSVFGRSPVFAFGILAAWFHHRHGDALRGRLASIRALRNGGGDALLVAILFVLGLLLRWSANRGFGQLEMTRRFVWHVPEGALWTVVVLMVMYCPLRMRGLLCNRLTARIGVLSYSIYLLHMPLLYYALRAYRSVTGSRETSWTPAITVWFAAALLLCVGVSMVTYRFIERPFLVRKASLGGGRSYPAARAA